MIVHNVHGARARERMFRALRGAGAVSPERARTLEQLGLRESPIFRRYRDLSIIREANSGSFYLDEPALREHRQMMLRWLLVPFLVILALVVYAIAHEHR